MKYDMKRPCDNCPFRSDRIFEGLSSERIILILKSITERDQSFTCHKTTGKPESKQAHCGGALIFLEKIKRPNQMMRIMERLRAYHPDQLDMKAPVFDTAQEMIDAYKGSE